MADEPKTTYGPDEIRAEHRACVDYHTALGHSRFTVVGLYVAAMGFIASVLFRADTAWDFRAASSLLACLITFCLWVIELRTRALFTNIAYRGIEIERRYWGLVGKDLCSGFFSRQYKLPEDFREPNLPDEPRRSDPDCPRFGWGTQLSKSLSRYVSHSMGLDMLYGSGLLFWIAAMVIAIGHWLRL